MIPPARQISWSVELVVHPGREEQFAALTAEMVAAAATEAGTLIYERYIAVPPNRVYLYERYADEDAAVRHLEVFASTFAARFSALVSRRRFTVYGVPGSALTRRLDAMGAGYVRPWVGFTRCARGSDGAL